MWQDCCLFTGADPDSLGAIVHFGDTADMSDELLALILRGTKRATAALVSDFQQTGDPIPAVGGHWIVVDSRGAPGCVLRISRARTGPLDSVDDTFAWEEGEGERTRDWWMHAHRTYFNRQSNQIGKSFDEATDLVVFERFDLVWPKPTPCPWTPLSRQLP